MQESNSVVRHLIFYYRRVVVYIIVIVACLFNIVFSILYSRAVLLFYSPRDVATVVLLGLTINLQGIRCTCKNRGPVSHGIKDVSKKPHFLQENFIT